MEACVSLNGRRCFHWPGQRASFSRLPTSAVGHLRGNDLDPACSEVSGYLKPITTLHCYYRFKNVSGIMSNSIEKRLWASDKAAVTSLPSIFPGCQDTPPQGEGVYKFNLVVHTRVNGGTNQLSLCAVTSSQPVSNGQ